MRIMAIYSAVAQGPLDHLVVGKLDRSRQRAQSSGLRAQGNQAQQEASPQPSARRLEDDLRAHFEPLFARNAAAVGVGRLPWPDLIAELKASINAQQD